MFINAHRRCSALDDLSARFNLDISTISNFVTFSSTHKSTQRVDAMRRKRRYRIITSLTSSSASLVLLLLRGQHLIILSLLHLLLKSVSSRVEESLTSGMRHGTAWKVCFRYRKFRQCFQKSWRSGVESSTCAPWEVVDCRHETRIEKHSGDRCTVTLWGLRGCWGVRVVTTGVTCRHMLLCCYAMRYKSCELSWVELCREEEKINMEGTSWVAVGVEVGV